MTMRATHTTNPNLAGAERGRSGFSMLEIMVALAVLALGVLGMTAGQLAAMKLSGDSQHRTTAMSLAQQGVEAVQTMSAADVKDIPDIVGYPNDPANPIDPTPGNQDTIRFFRTWDVQEDTPEAGVITVTITVSWTDDRGANRAVRLRTLKADV